MQELIYGKNPLERIVSVQPNEKSVEIFRQLEDGSVVSETVPMKYYILFSQPHSPKFVRLAGDQPFRYIYESESRSKYQEVLKASYKKRYDLHVIRDHKEMFLSREGYTYFKGMKVEDVSVLSFDLETTGLVHDDTSRVLLISTTFRCKGKIERKLFALDDCENDQAAMLTSFYAYVRKINPSIIVGHNIYGFDLPYLQYVSQRYRVPMKLGRDGSEIYFSDRTSQFRKDGSQSYDYTNALIYGREIVDTYFLAMKSDISRTYESYGLKQIIKQEGLERPGRQHYDASRIAKDWPDLEKRKQIKAYAIDDADDALKLYDLMIPSLFYLNQSVPRSLQQIVNSASGSQLNGLMVRAYLQQGHSIARGSDAVEYEGAISFGNPGIHKNVFKVDVSAMYPSIMLQYNIYPKQKDPYGYSLKMLGWFTNERVNNKRLAKETSNRYFKDLSEAQKIVCNSWYGASGAPKLNYNYPEGAAKVTEHGRNILNTAIDWAKDTYGFVLCNGDTDSIAFKKPDSKAFTREERVELLKDLNSRMDERIKWEDDNHFKKFIVIKAKNYILQDDTNKIKIKGSALKATTKEKALQRFLGEVIDLLLKDRKDRIFYLYQKYANEILNLTSIDDWCSKVTITKAVIGKDATRQAKIRSALEGSDWTEGDKVYLFNRTSDELCLKQNFDGTYDADTLLGKLYDTLTIFETVIDVSLIPNFNLKRNKDLLGEADSRLKLIKLIPPTNQVLYRS